MAKTTYEQLQHYYDYLFNCSPSKFLITLLEAKEGCLSLFDLKIRYMTFYQMGMEVKGFRFGSLAYLSDIKEFDPTIFSALKGIKTLIISALRYKSSLMHFNVDEALGFAKKACVQTVILTHISHELEHEQFSNTLANNAAVAYDGMKFSFNVETS